MIDDLMIRKRNATHTTEVQKIEKKRDSVVSNDSSGKPYPYSCV